jgi:serine/threonine protein kinase
MAPEYAMCGQYSIKSDVFSFGVLVLEIVTGRRNSGSYDSDNDVDLLNLVSMKDFVKSQNIILIIRLKIIFHHMEQVWDHWIRGNVINLIDPSLGDHPPIEQMLKCIHIGLLCVQRKPTARPTMSSVNIMLNSSTVRLPSLTMPALCIQDNDTSASDSSGAFTATQTGASNNSVIMSCNGESITELLPR